MPPTAAKDKPKPDAARPLKTCGLFEDEVLWASLIGAYRGQAIAKVLSPMIREALRKALKEMGVDPDRAWEEYQARRRAGA